MSKMCNGLSEFSPKFLVSVGKSQLFVLLGHLLILNPRRQRLIVFDGDGLLRKINAFVINQLHVGFFNAFYISAELVEQAVRMFNR